MKLRIIAIQYDGTPYYQLQRKVWLWWQDVGCIQLKATGLIALANHLKQEATEL